MLVIYVFKISKLTVKLLLAVCGFTVMLDIDVSGPVVIPVNVLIVDNPTLSTVYIHTMYSLLEVRLFFVLSVSF